MSKRFTETEKWSDPWFRKLDYRVKIGYLYLLDRVDNSGVIDMDTELANFQIGIEIDWLMVANQLGDRMEMLPNGKWHLTRFVAFQFGELNPDCKPHAQVVRLMTSHGIQRVSKGYPKGINTPQDKDKDKEKDKDKKQETEKESDKTTNQIRVEKLYRRKESTKWSGGELRAWKIAESVVAETSPENWEILERWYGLPPEKAPYRKTDMAALMNNWHAEIEKARRNNSPQTQIRIGL